MTNIPTQETWEKLKAAAQLEESPEKEAAFQQLEQEISDVFWVATPDLSEYYYISPKYEQKWGKSIASLQENPHSFLESIHPDDRERVREAVIANPYQTDVEYRLLEKDGGVCWIHDQTFPVTNSEGKVYQLVGMGVDITEQKK